METMPNPPGARWAILALAALTNLLLVAAPSMAMPVLFEAISADLGLNLVQVGAIWGISALPGIFTGLLGGAIGDRFGPKRVLVASSLLVGLVGALRGLAVDFLTLAAAMLAFGLVTPFVTMNTLKTCGQWFPPRQLGLASGVLSMAMALGFLAGSLLSGTLLSPLLGGWRPVLFFYGALAAILCLPWILTRPAHETATGVSVGIKPATMRQTVAHVARIRNVWLFGLALMGIGGCIQGALGYIPLYLRGLGWPEATADGALAAFHMISLVFTLPVALGSDKLGRRKPVLAAAGLMIVLGFSLLSIARGAGVWIAVGIAGMVRDGFMAVFMTSIIETEGVGTAYAGSAIGVVLVFSGLGNLLAPPLGNSLAALGPGVPFVFWAALAVLGLGGILAVKEKRAGQTPERFDARGIARIPEVNMEEKT